MYSLMQSGEITTEQAADMMGLPVHGMVVRLAKWGHRLPLLLATLDKIAQDKIARSEAAELLEVTTRQINMLMVSWTIKRPLKPYLIERAAAKVKWEIRKKWAIDYVADSCTIDEAAEGAGVSDRQMRRWVSELVNQHFGMAFKDLRTLSSAKRKRLADEIETKEGLELAKQQVLKTITSGERTVQDEAIDRLLAKRIRKERAHVQTR
jgi:hypothetical protein